MEERSKGPVPLGDAIKDFLREAGLGARSRDGEVLRAWARAYEKADARAVGFRNRTLQVETPSPAVLQDLRGFTGDDYRRKANAILGEERIQRIVVRLRS